MPLRQHLDVLLRDIRFAARGFLRAPTFTLAAVFAVAVGIGAGTAVFSVVDRILFRSLPYADAGRLVSFGMVAPIVPQEFMLGYDYIDWRDSQTAFESMASWTGIHPCDLTDTNPVRLSCARVEASLLPALGIQPLLGRNFTPEHNRPNAPRVALISYGLWRSRFAGDPGIAGRTIPLDGRLATVLGVLPPHFEMPTLVAADLLVPYTVDEAEQRTRKSAVLFSTIARLKPGTTVAQAGAALQPLFQKSLQSVSPEFRKDVKLRIRPLRDRQIQDARTASWVLLGSVIAVLLIACANVANLLLARMAARQREFAVRAALGAGRRRLVRQALTESTLLALIGGAAGCALAFVLLRVFVAIAPEGIPRLSQASLDLRVLSFTLAASLISGLLFGVAPALQVPRAETLAGSRVLGGRQHLFRHVLVAAQIGVSLVLLTGATLLLRSLWNLQNQPLGIQPQSVLAATVALGQQAYPDAARRLAFFEQLEEHLRGVPGTTEVAVSDSLPLVGNETGAMLYGAIDVNGRPQFKDGTGGRVAWRNITPRYFAALGIPILRGRAFSEQDRDPNQNAVILSATLARRMFPGEDALGRQIRPGRIGPWLTVVGVAGNVKNNGLAEADDPELYQVRKHSPERAGRAAVAIIRTAADPRAAAGPVRAVVASLDPTLPVKIETMQQRVGALSQKPRFNAVLLGIFAAMGLLLAAVGLYGVISFLVAQRVREIGVRMALGATPGAIARLVLGHALRWTAAGAVLGIAGSLFAVRLLRAMLFRVPARDPWTLAFVLALLLCVTLGAAWFPSRRAARLDPVETLRQE